MILSDIKKYLVQRKVATLGDVAVHFDIQPDAIRGMMEHWIQKGKVMKHNGQGTCSKGCGKCDSSHIEMYEWIA